MKILFVITFTLFSFASFGIQSKVVRIIDGDTFLTESGEKVRLVGINAPEITDVFGQEAKVHLAQLIDGQTVDLLADHTSNDRDRYNRLLRYVILNGVDINKKMLLDGYAFAYLKFHFDKESEYRQAQLDGNKNNNGIWSNNNNPKNIEKEQSEQPINFESTYSLKFYIISGLLLLLIIIGLWGYYKK